jgi:hypothetical protein
LKPDKPIFCIGWGKAYDLRISLPLKTKYFNLDRWLFMGILRILMDYVA